MTLETDGFLVFTATEASRIWAEAAFALGRRIANDPDEKAKHLRFQGTWFVGVDALPNKADGSLDRTPFAGPWDGALPKMPALHRGQLSIIYPGYPRQDEGQSAANHRFRVERSAAHVDGLLPFGPERKRYALEYHAFILGVHLNACSDAPTVVWRGSHHIMRAALVGALAHKDAKTTDVTEAYAAARKRVFETCEKVALPGNAQGDAFVLDRFALHGTDPWTGPRLGQGRMTAFFRPCLETVEAWLRV